MSYIAEQYLDQKSGVYMCWFINTWDQLWEAITNFFKELIKNQNFLQLFSEALLLKLKPGREFPGGPVADILWAPNAVGLSSISRQGTRSYMPQLRPGTTKFCWGALLALLYSFSHFHFPFTKARSLSQKAHFSGALAYMPAHTQLIVKTISAFNYFTTSMWHLVTSKPLFPIKSWNHKVRHN